MSVKPCISFDRVTASLSMVCCAMEFIFWVSSRPVSTFMSIPEISSGAAPKRNKATNALFLRLFLSSRQGDHILNISTPGRAKKARRPKKCRA
jgi:hypothetical protein